MNLYLYNSFIAFAPPQIANAAIIIAPIPTPINAMRAIPNAIGASTSKPQTIRNGIQPTSNIAYIMDNSVDCIANNYLMATLVHFCSARLITAVTKALYSVYLSSIALFLFINQHHILFSISYRFRPIAVSHCPSKFLLFAYSLCFGSCRQNSKQLFRQTHQ